MDTDLALYIFHAKEMDHDLKNSSKPETPKEYLNIVPNIRAKGGKYLRFVYCAGLNAVFKGKRFFL
jgi:hypothetical protein